MKGGGVCISLIGKHPKSVISFLNNYFPQAPGAQPLRVRLLAGVAGAVPGAEPHRNLGGALQHAAEPQAQEADCAGRAHAQMWVCLVIGF